MYTDVRVADSGGGGGLPYSPWTHNNPYLHTSPRPYVVPLQPPVRPDQQYPQYSPTPLHPSPSSLHPPPPACLRVPGYPSAAGGTGVSPNNHQHHPDDPLYESINSVLVRPLPASTHTQVNTNREMACI